MSTEPAKKQSKKVSKPKKVEEPSAPVAETVKVEVVSKAPSEKKGKKEKKENKEKKSPSPKEAEAPVAEESAPEAEDAALVVEESHEEKSDEKLSRKKKNYNQLVAEVEHLNQLVEKYVSEHKDVKVPGMPKFLKDLERGLKKVRFQVQKIGKNKSAHSGTNVQSGFQKPVQISESVARFTGWDVSEPKARVEVTNFVCDYIKKNNLQSPADKRIILADDNLKQLLDYNHERDGDLTYATIQKLLAKHYTALVASA